jgi:alkylhydroperoxidase family enzyme
LELGSELTKDVLDRGLQADVRPAVRAALRIIERMVEGPEGPRAEDIAAARAAGIDEEGLRTAILVCVAFTMIVRLADTFDFTIRSPQQFEADAKVLLQRGYG